MGIEITGPLNEAKVAGTANRAGKLLAALLAVASIGFAAGCTNLAGSQTRPIASQQLSLQFSPSSLNFGTVASGKKTSQNASVTNTGNNAATIAQIISSSNQFTTSGLAFPLTIAPAQTVKFAVWFNGSAPGKSAATLTFQGSDGAAAAAQIAVTATEITPQPQLVVSTASLDAGSATVGSKTTSNITVSNSGTADLTISTLTVAGAPFSVLGIATPATLPAGQSAALSVVYAPTVTGTDSGSITISSNDPASPKTILLSGTGTSTPVGHLTLNPSTLAFGNVSVGANSVLSATLTNSGQGAVHISSVFASGSGYTETGITTPATLTAGQSAQVQVKFAPTAAGTTGGTVGITSDAPGAAPGLALTGAGVQPGISVSPASVSFGSLIDGQTKALPVVITNTGSADLKITQVSSTGTGISLSGLAAPVTISAGQSSTLTAQFAPQTAGAVTGSISLTTNASGSPTVVALSGTGVAATSTLSVSPGSLSFGNVNVGGSANQTITITNTGNSSTNVSQIGVTGTGLTVSGVTAPLTLAPSQNATLTVQFSPTSTATTNGTISVVTQSGTTPVGVTGTGAQAGLSLSQNTVTFSNVVTGSSNSQALQITNTGNSPLTITQANVTGSGFSLSGLSLPATLTAGQKVSPSVVYAPQSAGTVTGNLAFVSNASGSPATVSLSGSSTAATHTLSVSPGSLSFGNINAGSTSTKTVTLTNTGNSDVAISQITANGTGFALSGAAGVTLSAGQNSSFSVLFNPSAAGSDTGNVSIISNATGSPTAVSLSGTGVALPVQHNVQLGWTSSTSAVSGYNVYRSTTSGSGYVQVNGSLVTPDSYVDGTVQGGTTYFYVTTAVDGSGTESGYSNEAQAIIP
jgi:hypothetical protein